jgi:hypothetical protein
VCVTSILSFNVFSITAVPFGDFGDSILHSELQILPSGKTLVHAEPGSHSSQYSASKVPSPHHEIS